MAYYDDALDAKTALKRRQPGQVPGTPQAPAAYSTTGGVGDAQSQLPTGQAPPAVTPPAPGQTAPAETPPVSPAFGAESRPARDPRRTFDPERPPTQDDLPDFPRPPRDSMMPPGAPQAPEAPQNDPAPPDAPAPPGGGWDAPPPDGNWESWFLNNVKSLPPTPQSLVSIESQLGKHGIKVLRNAEGTAGKIQLPNGQIIDVVLAAGVGGRAWQWMTPDQAGAGQAPAEAAASGMPTLGSLTSNLSAAGLTSFQEQMRAMILQQLAGAAKPVDPNDPEMRLPINEAERRAEEIRRRRQSADAERLTQRGIGDSGALDTARRQGFEDMSQTISGVTAQIIGEQMQNKKRELITLLQTAMASGDAESARAVQMQLAAIDAELRRMGLRQQNEQFHSGQAQQQGQFDSQMDYNWAQFQSGLL